MQAYLLNIAGSVTAIGMLYGLYILCAFLFSSDKALLEMWWLPTFNCYRVVIRNIPRGYEITDIRSNTWLRYTVPPSVGCSVHSFRDINVVHNERIMLSKSSDFPIACFRLQPTNDGFEFISTDKFGVEISSYRLNQDFENLSMEYSVRVQTWKLLKYEIDRTFVVPKCDKSVGRVLEAIVAMQEEGRESRFPVMFRTAEVIRISI